MSVLSPKGGDMKGIIIGLMAMVAIPFSVEAADYSLSVTLPQDAHVRETVTQTIDMTENGKHQVVTSRREYLNTLEARDGVFHIHKLLNHFEITPDKGDLGDDALDTAIGMLRVPDVPVIDYIAGQTLYPREIANWDAVKTDIKARLNISQGSTSASMLDLMNANSGALLFTKQDALLYYARGVTLSLNTPVRTESTVTAPIGGGQVKAVTTMTLTAWDTHAGVARIDYDFAPDPTSMTAYIRALAPKILGATYTPDMVQKATASMQMVNSIHCHYEVAIATNLVNSARCEMHVAVDVLDYHQDRTESFDMTESLVP
jgi:hypothetical protein